MRSSLVEGGQSTCLNCDAPLTGAYCAVCGQRIVDLAAPTAEVVRDAVSEAFDLDGRVLRTLRALVAPGRLTVEFLRGRRAPYIGPLKLFLFAGAALSTTWLITRGIDARFYGFALGKSAAEYIDRVVRGSLAAGLAIASSSWAMARARRRLLDETVFALHVVTALSLLTTTTIWIATAWKLAWGHVDRVPAGVPSLPFLLFFPAMIIALAYIVAAVRRVHGGAWWSVAVRGLLITTVGLLAVTIVVLGRLPP